MSTSKIRVDEITNEAGTGAPSMPFDGAGAGMAANNMTDAVSELKSNLDNFEAVPSGALMYFTMNTPPTGWLKANGAAISRTTFSALFDAIGTTFGAGDGSTTFNLPDMRGEFPRGWDDGRGVDSGRSFGTAQLDQMQKITGSVGSAHNASGQVLIRNVLTENLSGVFKAGATNISKRLTNTAFTSTTNDGRTLDFDSAGSSNARVSSTTSGETRSRNIALLACIKF